MSAKSRFLEAKFSRETRFEVCPIISAPFRGPVEWRLDQLKSKLLQPVLSGMRNAELQSKLCWAAQEAASLAWMTPIPLLVFSRFVRRESRRGARTMGEAATNPPQTTAARLSRLSRRARALAA
jgi:hypothetical protein